MINKFILQYKNKNFWILYAIFSHIRIQRWFLFRVFLIKWCDNTLKSFRMGNTWRLELLNSSLWKKTRESFYWSLKLIKRSFFERSDILKAFLQLFTEQKPGFLFWKKCWWRKNNAQRQSRAKMESNYKILNLLVTGVTVEIPIDICLSFSTLIHSFVDIWTDIWTLLLGRNIAASERSKINKTRMRL